MDVHFKKISTWKKQAPALWTSQTLSLIAASVTAFAVNWQLSADTDSAIVLTAATFFTFLPEVLVPLASPIIDRKDRKWVLIMTNLGTAAVSLLLGLCFACGLANPAVMIAAVFLRASCSVLRWPAMQAIVAETIPEKALTRFNSVDYILRGSAGIAGPMAGAAILHLLPIEAVLGADAVLSLAAIVPAALVKVKPAVSQGSEPYRQIVRGAFRDLREGLEYVLHTPGLMLLLVYVSVANLLEMPADSLMPLMVADVFSGSADSYSWITMLFGIGTVAGGLALTLWGGFRSRVRTCIAGDLIQACAIFMIGIVPSSNLRAAGTAWFFAGVGEAFALAPLNALIQSRTRPEMQGRVFSISSGLINLTVPLGLLLSGTVAEQFGLRTWYAGSGLVCMLFAGCMMFIPAMLRYEKLKPANAE